MAALVGSNGTLVAAVLESAGYYYQSYVIDFFLIPFGGLVYLAWIIGAFLALIIYFISGSARNAATLLIGPCLFFAFVFQRTPTSGSAWKYGDQDRNQTWVAEDVEGMVGDKPYTPQIASSVAVYNRLVSAFVQDVVERLNGTRTSSDSTMVVRTQFYSFMMSRELQQPGLSELLHLSLLGQCREMLDYGREMADKRLKPAERCEWAKEYKAIAERRNIELSFRARDYLAGLDVNFPMVTSSQVANTSQQELAAVETELGGLGATCPLAIAGGATGNPQDAATIAEQALAQAAANRAAIAGASGNTRGVPETIEEIQAAAALYAGNDADYAAARAIYDSNRYTCHDVWNFVYGALHLEAGKVRESVRDEATKRGMDVAALMNDLMELTDSADEKGLIRAIARRIFRIEAARGSNAAMIAEYERRGPEIANIGIGSAQSITQSEAELLKGDEWVGKGSLLMTAYSLPYYQGLILYFLSIAFPFFALLLIIPGRQMTFGLWFLFWLWAKSWDIGFAIVSLIDDTLQSLFLVRLDVNAFYADQTLDPNFATAISALREIDPTFDVSTYYNIVSVCLMSVPMIMSIIVLGSSSMFVSIVQNGVSTGNNLGLQYGKKPKENTQQQQAQQQTTSGGGKETQTSTTTSESNESEE